MIKTRRDHADFWAADLQANGLERWSFAQQFRRPEVYYVKLLRRVEYLLAQPGPTARVRRALARFRLLRQSVRTGLTIPPNVFGPGLSVAHYGSIVVNTRARVGSYCRIHSATNIGTGADGGVPTIGDYVFIGPGAVVYGNVRVGDRVVIGANAVVGRDVPDGVTVAGAPARIIARVDSSAMMPAGITVPASQDSIG